MNRPRKGCGRFAGDDRHIAAAIRAGRSDRDVRLTAPRSAATHARPARGPLHLFAAEAPPMAQRLAYDAMGGQTEHARDDGHAFLPRMLRRGAAPGARARLVVVGVRRLRVAGGRSCPDLPRQPPSRRRGAVAQRAAAGSPRLDADRVAERLLGPRERLRGGDGRPGLARRLPRRRGALRRLALQCLRSRRAPTPGG